MASTASAGYSEPCQKKKETATGMDVDTEIMHTFGVTLPDGSMYSAEVDLRGTIDTLRSSLESQLEIPPACLLKLFQNGEVLADVEPLKNVDIAEPVFGVIAQETSIEVLLQAAGKFWGYKDILQSSQITSGTKLISLPAFPDIMSVLEEMGGQAPEVPDLQKGKGDKEIEFFGSDGQLLLPSIDAGPLLEMCKVKEFLKVTVCVEINSDAYNRGLGLVLEASPLMSSTVDERGVPSYIYNGYGISNDKKQNAVKFHPGMHGGQLRIEGVGGFYNSDVGFTPQSWTGSSNKYHTMEITLGSDGKNEVCLKGTQEGQEWRQPWERQLTAGRHFPAIYAWLDMGSKDGHGLHVRNISMRVHIA